MKKKVVLSIFGSNTDVGKTMCSLGLVGAGLRRGRAAYLKPVQTGPEGDAEAVQRHHPKARAETMYWYAQPVSPHVAAKLEGTKVPSRGVLKEEIVAWAESSDENLLVMETAGGPLSPSPDGTLQADLWPTSDVVLVGDARLGGISATLCAAEALERRGFALKSLILVGQDRSLGNKQFLRDYYFQDDVLVLGLPAPPPRPAPLADWLTFTAPAFDKILTKLLVAK
mmetsp:Transcript_20455/g.65893  ORF Transcript_20455/g.65893 Transcript_20455/m.65893 type:complete len:226 (-) Transcript_20455:991-1668(-)